MTDNNPEIFEKVSSKDQLIYSPLLRNGPHEKRVIREFGGLSRYTPQEENRAPFYPILEVTSNEDLGDLELYLSAGDKVLIDLPVYLTEEENKYQDSTSELLHSSEDTVSFFTSQSESIPVPVLSGSMTAPVDYARFKDRYTGLTEVFEEIAIRLFIRPENFTKTQLNSLKQLADEVRDSCIILLDLVSPKELEPGELGYDNSRYVSNLFSSNTVIILNAFSSYEGVNENYGPRLATEFGADGFGDYGINLRFPSEAPLGNIQTRKIRQYSPTESQTFVFKGIGYSGAYEHLEDWERWDPNHCEYCNRMAIENTEYFPFWKETRMGHYFHCALFDEAHIQASS